MQKSTVVPTPNVLDLGATRLFGLLMKFSLFIDQLDLLRLISFPANVTLVEDR